MLLLVFIHLFLLDLARRRVVGRRGVAAGVAGARLFGLDAALGVGGKCGVQTVSGETRHRGTLIGL